MYQVKPTTCLRYKFQITSCRRQFSHLVDGWMDGSGCVLFVSGDSLPHLGKRLRYANPTPQSETSQIQCSPECDRLERFRVRFAIFQFQRTLPGACSCSLFSQLLSTLHQCSFFNSEFYAVLMFEDGCANSSNVACSSGRSPLEKSPPYKKSFSHLRENKHRKNSRNEKKKKRRY